MNGRHKVFLGMAAGVGKTYRMLQEGRAALGAGRDVVIGYLEPHDRAETEAEAEGLPRVARRRVGYRGVELEEMDLPAILRRRPELCLIDELAHTNAPGLEHVKRYEDVADVLAAGIDVFSTVNVQHLESLNDQVARAHGRARAGDVPRLRALRRRRGGARRPHAAGADRAAAGGQGVPAARVPAALNGFFRVENLEALREVALRQVAEDVEAKRLRGDVIARREDRLFDTAAPQAVAERLLALATPAAGVPADRPPRVALRAAAGRGARRADRAPARAVGRGAGADRGVPPARLDARRAGDRRGGRRRRGGRCARRARARLDVRPDGRAGAARGLRRLSPTLTDRLVRALPGVDVRIVADRSKRER